MLARTLATGKYCNLIYCTHTHVRRFCHTWVNNVKDVYCKICLILVFVTLDTFSNT